MTLVDMYLNTANMKMSTFMHGFEHVKHSLPGMHTHLSPRLEQISTLTKSTFPSLHHQMISPLQSRFLAFLLGMIKPKRILELGSFTGYSAASMSSACPEAEVWCVEKDPRFIGVLRENVPEASIVEQSCAQFLNEFDGAKFDFCFVDADKKGYGEYRKVLREKSIVNRNGIVLYDNVLFRDQVFGDGKSELCKSLEAFVMEAVNEGAVLLPAFDGILMETVK